MCPSLPFFGQDSQKENLQLFQKWKTNAYFHFRSIIARNSYIFCITYFNKKKMKWLYPKTCSFKMQLVEIGYFRTQNVVFLILVLVLHNPVVTANNVWDLCCGKISNQTFSTWCCTPREIFLYLWILITGRNSFEYMYLSYMADIKGIIFQIASDLISEEALRSRIFGTRL